MPGWPQRNGRPRGEIRWRRSGDTRVVFFNYGCMSDEARQALKQVNAVDAMVEAWAADAPVMDEQREP